MMSVSLTAAAALAASPRLIDARAETALLTKSIDETAEFPFSAESTVFRTNAANDYWPAKNNDANRSGATESVAPSNLTGGPTGRWTSDFPNDIIRAAPLIDAAGDVYIATVTSGRLLKFRPSGDGLTGLWNYTVTPHSEVPAVPAMLNGLVYIATHDGYVIAIEELEGLEIWRASINDTKSGDASAVAAASGTVITTSVGGATGGEARLVALEAASGAIRWAITLPDAAEAYNAMPLIVDGSVVISDSQGGLQRFDLASGTLEWRTPPPYPDSFTTGGAAIGSAHAAVNTVFVTSNKNLADSMLRQVVPFLPDPTGLQGVVSAYDLADGTLKWQVELGEDSDANNAPSVGPLDGPDSAPRVVIAVGPNPTLVMTGKDADGTVGKARPGRVLALDSFSGDLVWEYELPLWHGGPAGDSILHTCLPDSSANIAIGGDGVVYVPHEDGAVYAIKDADGDDMIDPSEVTSYDLGRAFQGSPAIAPGLLAVAPCDGLAVYVE